MRSDEGLRCKFFCAMWPFVQLCHLSAGESSDKCCAAQSTCVLDHSVGFKVKITTLIDYQLF